MINYRLSIEEAKYLAEVLVNEAIYNHDHKCADLALLIMNGLTAHAVKSAAHLCYDQVKEIANG